MSIPRSRKSSTWPRRCLVDLTMLMTLVRWPKREEGSTVARVVSEQEVPKGRLTTPTVDWGSFADGQIWELVQGEDFHQEPARANRAARQWASHHGYRCQAHKEGTNKIRVRFDKVVISDADKQPGKGKKG